MSTIVFNDEKHEVEVKFNLESKQGIDFHSLSEMKMESDGQTKISMKDNMYIKSKVSVDVEKE